MSVGRVYTAGVFDLFHAGHMESIMKILNKFPDRELMIGVATNKYTKSFKRTPIQTCEERMDTIQAVFSSNPKVIVMEDPLDTYIDNYEKWFYDKYNITDHCQGTDFDENPDVYKYIRSINGFHIMGRSDLMSTTELINRLTPSRVLELEGDTNRNYRLGNIVIKRVVYGDVALIDDAYTQLLEKRIFGITSYQRFDSLVFLPFIEGNVTPDVSVAEVLELSKKINESGLVPRTTLSQIFDRYGFVPDYPFYSSLLDNMTYVCHGDMAYTNLVKGQTGLNPIDWEFLCYAVEYWDLSCFLASIYVYQHADCRDILDLISDMDDSEKVKKAVMLLCDYWIAWSLSTGHDYFSKELKMLKSYLHSTL